MSCHGMCALLVHLCEEGREETSTFCASSSSSQTEPSPVAGNVSSFNEMTLGTCMPCAFCCMADKN